MQDKVLVIIQTIKMKYLFSVLLFALLISACNNEIHQKVDDSKVNVYGNDFDDSKSLSVSETIQNLQDSVGIMDFALDEETTVKAIETQISGSVIDVCKKAGCWMTISDDKGQEIFVKTNHEFFMPLDIVNKKVVVDGKAYFTTVSVAELRHYAEDEGKSPEEIEKITTPETTYEMLATGVKTVIE